jgi:uncharacterized protein (TIGR00255 family)
VRSMTGYGLGEAPLGKGRALLELRSLNHRYLDVRVRLPPELLDHGFWLEQLARERLSRGRFDVGVRLEGAALPPPRIALERARAVYAALRELRDELAPDTELPVGALAAIPDLVNSAALLDSGALRVALTAAFEQALQALERMREREGAVLKQEIAERLGKARHCRDAIAARSGELVAAYRAKLSERLAKLLHDAGVALETGRLETEVALIADRTDVTEELVRLKSHFDQFEELSLSGESVGRRLDFFLQEIGREVNTIGAKCQDAPVAHLVVELKAEIERMREQVQNVE